MKRSAGLSITSVDLNRGSMWIIAISQIIGFFQQHRIHQHKPPSQSACGSRHGFKYRLALVISGDCVLRYDNEAGKGDHRHVRDKEEPYSFTNPEKLLDDFWRDVAEWRS